MPVDPQIHRILELSQLAPSVHNTQPWRIRFSGESLSVGVQQDCLTPVADPENRDTWVSLGILVDVLENLFHAHGFQTTCQLLRSTLSLDTKSPVFKIDFKDQGGPKNSKYLESLQKRRAYRGPFTMSDQTISIDHSGTSVITEASALKALAKTYHECAAKQSLSPGYMDELRRWIRLSKDEAGFGKDGLDFISLNLNAFETFFAKLLMSDKWLFRLKKIGLHGLLTDESSGFKNMTGIIVNSIPATDLTPEVLIAEGRRYIQVWLELVDQGFEACPISTLIDLPEGQKKLTETLQVTQAPLFTMALRFGKSDGSPVRRVRRSSKYHWNETVVL